MPRDIASDPLLRDVPQFEGYMVLDPVVLLEKLGQGGMGAVYRGRHLKLGIDVALKCLKRSLADENPEFISRFKREARVAAVMSSEHLVQVFDVAEAHGLHYLVMEFVRGESARERVGRKGRLNVEEACAIVLGACRGMHTAHRKGVIHRDLKPDNIMIGTNGVVKVADLGLATAADTFDSLRTASGMIMGTPAYMPPEQFKGAKGAEPSGDVYALALTLYYLLTAEHAIQSGPILQVADQVCRKGIPPITELRGDLPPELLELIRRSTSLDAADRPADGGALAGELAPFCEAIIMPEALRDEAAGLVVRQHDYIVSPPPGETLARIKSGQKALKLRAANGVSGDIDSAGQAHGRDGNSFRAHPKPEYGYEELRTADSTIGPTALTPFRWRLCAVLVGAIISVCAIVSLFMMDDESPEKSQHNSDTEDVVVTLHKRFPGLTLRSKNSRGYEEFTLDKDPSVVMIRVPGGSFTMGMKLKATHSDLVLGAAKPKTLRITLDEYLISKNELTVAQYRRFAKANSRRMVRVEDWQDEDHPVVNVSWREAREYCEWAGLQLPTEAQWSYAAAGSTDRLYPWGDEGMDNTRGNYSGFDDAGAWQKALEEAGSFMAMVDANKPVFSTDSYVYTAPVGSFDGGVGPFGTHNQAANVTEWCEDEFEERFDSQRRYGDGLWVHGAIRQRPVIRGGTWFATPELCLNSRRIGAQGTANSNPGLGFRPALTPRRITRTTSGLGVDPPHQQAGLAFRRINEQGLEEFTLDKDPSVILIRIPGKSFSMGSTNGNEDEKPVTSVKLSDYFISKYEITIAQYRRYSSLTGRAMAQAYDHHREDHPVVFVSWGDARGYCKWAGLGLPTEAQWEHACRAGTDSPFAFGADLEHHNASFANRHVASVGWFAPNAFGIHDMHGFVFEWCQDKYGSYDQTPRAGDGLRPGDMKSNKRIIRGGSFISPADGCRSAFRGKANASSQGRLCGFRPVLTPIG